MTALKKIRNCLGIGAEHLLVLLQLSLFVTFLLQIVFRYFLYFPVGWTTEWVTIAWLWGILFGYSFALRDSDMIRLDVVYLAVSTPVRRAFDAICALIVAAIFGWTLPACIEYVAFMKVERTAYMRIPYDLVFSIYIPFTLAVIVRALITAWKAITGKGYDPAASSLS